MSKPTWLVSQDPNPLIFVLFCFFFSLSLEQSKIFIRFVFLLFSCCFLSLM